MTFFQRLLALVFPGPRASSPSVDPAQQAVARAYLDWAQQRGLRLRAEDGAAVIGCLHGRDVLVDPGVDGPFPGWVELRIAVALPAVKALFMTRATKPTTFATAQLHALFADSVLGPALRAISVNARHVRLRLAPHASPVVVEHAVKSVHETLRFIHAAPESWPRHSCTTRRSTPSTNTTVPYPT